MIDEIDIKKGFYFHFKREMEKYSAMPFFYNLFSFGYPAYVVGGFFRDYLLNRNSRDLDVLVDTSFDELIGFIKQNNYKYSINRHNGLKIELVNFQIDIWSIDNNWAFKNNLVVLNEKDKLHSIAKGCFYNYDSLVISLNTFNFNKRYFNDFMKNKKLNILQENNHYKNSNPSIEANILRALYIKKEYNSTFTDSTSCYLFKKICFLKDIYGDEVERLNKVKLSYTKYSKLSDSDVLHFVCFIKNEGMSNDQLILNL